MGDWNICVKSSITDISFWDGKQKWKWLQSKWSELIHLSLTLHSIVPPKIRGNEDEAEKLMALVDTSVNIECKAMGTPPPQINWLKNGLPLPLSSHIRLLSAGQVVRLDCIVCHFLSAYGNGRCQLFPHLCNIHKMLFPKVWWLLYHTV